MTERLVGIFKAEGKSTEVLNASVGYYNSVRYLEQFLARLTHLEPDVIVVQYFVNDAEPVDFSKGCTYIVDLKRV